MNIIKELEKHNVTTLIENDVFIFTFEDKVVRLVKSELEEYLFNTLLSLIKIKSYG